MQKAFASVVSFHFRFVYKVTLLRRLVELPVCIPGAFVLLLPLDWFFVLMRFPASQMRFLSENDFGMPRERKWLINDSCAFSDERPGRFCLSELHLHPRGALQASPSASRRYLLCLGRFVSFQIYIGVKRNETVGSGMCGKGMWISAFYKGCYVK